MSDAPRTCSTCKHWKPTGKFHWPSHTVRLGKCHGLPDNFTEADASDDTGLKSWFEPPEIFGCMGWEARS